MAGSFSSKYRFGPIDIAVLVTATRPLVCPLTTASRWSALASDSSWAFSKNVGTLGLCSWLVIVQSITIISGSQSSPG
jgi:hypothetical protein